MISNRQKTLYFEFFFVGGNFFPLEKGRPTPWITFFLPILRCSQFGNDPQLNLANFDYRQGKARK
jgi:hypothetical protein